MTRRGCLSVVIATLWLLSIGCARGDETSAAAKAPGEVPEGSPPATLSPVVLPDLSQLAQSVQRQLRERYGSLNTTLGNRSASRTQLAAAYGDLGRLLLAAKFLDQAASCYAHAEELEPDDMRWPYSLGHAYVRKGDRARAAAAFERASKLKPSDLNALIWLGETYIDDGRPDSAQPIFQQALSLQPQSAAALFGAGRAALGRQSYQEAAELMERALTVQSQASAIHYPLAMAYRALGNRDKAEAHLRQRGSTFPDLPDPIMQPDADVLDSAVTLEGRGVQALRDADWKAAEAAFRKGLELEPRDSALRYWLGATLYAAGDVAGAEREFEAVLQQSPSFARAHFSLGMIDESRGRRSAAIEHLRKAVENDPKLPEARFRLADALRATGQVQASLAEYDAAVKFDPAMAEAWIGGARALIALGRTQQADRWLTQARRVHPSRRELAELQERLRIAISR